jgi:MSHA biogenesis protein MshM
MYNDHYHFEKAPFKLTPDTYFFCQLRPHEEAFHTLKISLEQEEGFIKITGPVGTGKTMLCRQLMSELGQEFSIAYIPNPVLPIVDLYKLIISELTGDLLETADYAVVFRALNTLLWDLKQHSKKTVLLIDEAQTMSDEGLEAIRLLTNLETKNGKLLQVVLFGQPELDKRLEAPHLLQLKQRILFSYKLTALTKPEFLDYVTHRIVKAGYSYRDLFEKSALNILYKASKGIPRLINILCHKSLIVSYAKGEKCVSKKSARIAVKDTLDSETDSGQSSLRSKAEYSDLILLSVLLVVLVMAVWHYWLGII